MAEETEQRTPRWGLGDALAGFVVGLLLSSVLASIWIGRQAGSDDELSIGGQALSTLGLWAGLAGAAVLAARRKGSGRLRDDFGFAAQAPDLVLGAVAGALAHELLLPVIALLLSPFIGHPEVSGPVEELIDSAQGVARVGLFLFVVGGAPVVEELFFRGLLLRSLQRRLGTVLAVVASSVLFGLAHPQDLPTEGLVLVMTSLAALAALLAILAVRTARLGAPVIAHAVFNAWTLVELVT